jgi:hypothetical protein
MRVGPLPDCSLSRSLELVNRHTVFVTSFATHCLEGKLAEPGQKHRSSFMRGFVTPAQSALPVLEGFHWEFSGLHDFLRLKPNKNAFSTKVYLTL